MQKALWILFPLLVLSFFWLGAVIAAAMLQGPVQAFVDQTSSGLSAVAAWMGIAAAVVLAIYVLDRTGTPATTVPTWSAARWIGLLIVLILSLGAGWYLCLTFGPGLIQPDPVQASTASPSPVAPAAGGTAEPAPGVPLTADEVLDRHRKRWDPACGDSGSFGPDPRNESADRGGLLCASVTSSGRTVEVRIWLYDSSAALDRGRPGNDDRSRILGEGAWSSSGMKGTYLWYLLDAGGPEEKDGGRIWLESPDGRVVLSVITAVAGSDAPEEIFRALRTALFEHNYLLEPRRPVHSMGPALAPSAPPGR
jgi:hypothetical protein